MSMRLGAVVAASAAILLGAGSALAQAARMPLSASASALRRTMRGSDYYQVGVVPFGRFSYKEYQQYLQFGPNFGSRTYQARLNVMPYEGFELGPMVNYRRGRKHVE